MSSKFNTKREQNIVKKFIENNSIGILFIVHFFVVVIRCLIVLYGNIDLHTEEAQYWTWSQYLDWSYYSKPPMVAYLNYCSEWLFGHSEFSIRINAILLGFLTSIVTYLFTKELFKDKFKAFIASLLVYAMPFYLNAGLFFSTDAPLLFFALCAMYLGWMAIVYNKWKYWIGFSVALGLGYLSKYAMLFFIPIIFLYLFFTKRKILSNNRLYVSILFSFVFFLPVLIWNFKYDFIGLKHIINLSGVTAQVPNPFSRRMLKLAEYIGGQLAMISPLFLVFYFNAFKKYKAEKKVLYLWLPALVGFMLFAVVAVINRSGANVNWAMFSYVGFPVLLAHYIIESKQLKVSALLFLISLGLITLLTNSILLDKMGMSKIYPPQADALKKMKGWKEATIFVDSIENIQKSDKYFVFSDSYHTTSELRFYNYPKKDYYYSNRGNRMTQFDLWKGIEQFNNQGYSGIFVSKKYVSKIEKIQQLPPDIITAFDNNFEYYMHVTYYRGKPVAQYHIYVLHNFKSLHTHTNNY